MTFLETGQTVRWRGARWRVLGEEEGGFLRLVGVSPAFKDLELTPLLELERDELLPDEQPLPRLDVEASDRSRWRALHRAYLTTMAGGARAPHRTGLGGRSRRAVSACASSAGGEDHAASAPHCR